MKPGTKIKFERIPAISDLPGEGVVLTWNYYTYSDGPAAMVRVTSGEQRGKEWQVYQEECAPLYVREPSDVGTFPFLNPGKGRV